LKGRGRERVERLGGEVVGRLRERLHLRAGRGVKGVPRGTTGREGGRVKDSR